jgi:hypothetical protein
MNQLPRKSLVTANELEALLAKPLTTAGSTDKYFPMRLAILVFFSTIWFIRLTVFTHQIAEDLFSNPAIREYMLPAIYFRAWILFLFMSAGIWSYKNGKYPAIIFGLMFVLSLFNLIFDISIFYAEKLADQDPKITLVLIGRIFISYILFLSMRRANLIPKGRDKWDIFLPFKARLRT